MRTHEEVSLFRDESRMARLNALYEEYCQRGSSCEASVPDRSRTVTEVPCELAPGVRRRIARQPQ